MKKLFLSAVLIVLMLTLVTALASCDGSDNPSLISTSDETTTAPVTTDPPETELTWTTEVVAPTCTEGGYTIYTYSDGKVENKDELEALGHNFGEWVTTKAATCTATGTQTRTCSRCGEVETKEIPIAAHSYVSKVTPPTKTAQGFTTHTCVVCGDSYVDSYTNPTGSLGLAYSYNTDGSITITGIGSCTDEDVILYSTYYTDNGEKTVTAIAANAFENNDKIKSFAIPATVTSIGEGAFAACKKLVAFSIESANTHFSVSGGILYSKDGATIVAYPAGLDLTSFTISTSITAVRPSAFAGCFSLVEFKLASGHNGFIVENGVLYNKEMTTLIAYPAGKTESTFTVPSTVNTIGSYAFFRNKELSTITLPDRIYNSTDPAKIDIYGISTIGSYAFFGCKELTGIVIPDITSSVEIYAFAYCTKLSTIDFGKEYKTINPHTFEGCTAVVDLVIPETIEVIDDFAFYNCTAMKTLVIGSKVREIGENAFVNCLNHGKDTSGNNIAKVFYHGSADDWSRLVTTGIDPTNTHYLTLFATRYYYSETATTFGTYWRYVGGIPTPW